MSVIPTVLDQSARGERAFDIYSLLLRERIVFLGQEVDDQIANLLVAEILYLDSVDPGKDIYLYINSPGGVSYAGMAIYDVMQHTRSEVSTVCVGMGMSAAAMILCGGAPGKRLATPNAKIMIHQGTAGHAWCTKGHGDPPPGGASHYQADGTDHLVPLGPAARTSGARRRPGLLHDSRTGEGLRPHRRGHHAEAGHLGGAPCDG